MPRYRYCNRDVSQWWRSCGLMVSGNENHVIMCRPLKRWPNDDKFVKPKSFSLPIQPIDQSNINGLSPEHVHHKHSPHQHSPYVHMPVETHFAFHNRCLQHVLEERAMWALESSVTIVNQQIREVRKCLTT